MLIRWLGDPGGVEFQPPSHLLPSFSYGSRPLERAWMSRNAEESQKDRPWKTNPNNVVQLLIEPFVSPLMLRQLGRAGVYQDIGVEKYHLRKGP